jgi:hypothetical protein
MTKECVTVFEWVVGSELKKLRQSVLWVLAAHSELWRKKGIGELLIGTEGLAYDLLRSCDF